MKKLSGMAGALALSLFALASCKDDPTDLLPPHVPFEVTDLTNVMLPEVSIVPGMTVAVNGVGFVETDTDLVLKAAQTGEQVVPESVAVDEKLTNVRFTIPEACPEAEYAVLLTRADGRQVELGRIEVGHTIAIRELLASETYDRDSWITIHGQGFYEGDEIILNAYDESYTCATTVSSANADGGSVKFESPSGLTGRVEAQIKRGVVTSDLTEFVIGELLPEISEVVVPAVSIAPGMTLDVTAEGIATTDKDLLLVREGTELPLEEIELSETGFRFTIPSTAEFGTYKLCVDRVDNTRVELADIELVDEIEVSDVHLALDECPVNEPIVVYGTGFYAGDVIRFVSKEAGIDEKVETESVLSPEEEVLGVKLTPPADFIGEAELHVCRGTVSSLLLTVQVMDAIGNVVIPSFSIVPGQTVTIAATNVDPEDLFELRSASAEPIRPTRVASDNAGYTMTLPEDIPAGTYTLVSTRTEQELGELTVSDAIELDDLRFSDDMFIQGASYEVEVTTSSAPQAKTFAPGDRIRVENESSDVLLEEEIVLDASNASFSFQTPAELQGKGRVLLLRGALSLCLGTIDLIEEVKVGDYFKGGIVVWLDPQNPAHGICMNLFHGNATQRNAGLLHNRRTAFGHENLDHGTDRDEFMEIGMGDVCTQMILDAEETAGYDSTQPVREDPPTDGEALSAARICTDLVTTDKYTGETYDDWFLPTVKLLNHVYTIRKELNECFDREGGESFAGTGYVYQYGPEAGQNGYDSTDGSSNYISSNQSKLDPENGLNQARFQSFTDAGASGWFNKLDPYYYVRAARKF